MPRKARSIDESSIPATPNPLKRRDPELVKNFAAFRSRIGDALLDSLAPALADASFRARLGSEFLADLYAAARVAQVLAKEKWTERDLDTFDRYWRDASRSDYFADEFECERHRILACVDDARAKLHEPEMPTETAKVKQPTLW